MILVIRPDASLEQIEHVIERVQELGFTPHVSRGESRTIIGVIGDETKPQAENFSAIPGVEQVLPIMKPFKLASREFHKADSVGLRRQGQDRRRQPGHDRRAVRRRELRGAGHDRRLRQGRRGEHPPRRGVQAAHQPLRLPGHGRGRAEDPPRRRPEVRHAGRHRGHGPAAGGARRASTPTCSRSAPGTCRTSTCSRSAARPRRRCCSSAA